MSTTLAQLILSALLGILIMAFGIFAAVLAIWVELRRKP